MSKWNAGKCGRSCAVVAGSVLAVLFACDVGDHAQMSASGGAEGRDTVVIDAAVVECSSCRLTVVDSVFLGASSDTIIPERVPELRRDRDGNFYMVFNGWVNKPVLRYDSAGKFLGRIGAYGQGPGEYRMTSALLIVEDSVMLQTDVRLQTFRSGGEYLRSVTARGLRPFGLEADGSMLTTRSFRLPADSSDVNFVVRVNSDVSVRDSFPIFSPRPTAFARLSDGTRVPYLDTRFTSAVVHAPDGTIWVRTGMRFEQHASDGASLRVIGIAIPGMPPPVMTIEEVDSLLAQDVDAQGRPTQSKSPVTRATVSFQVAATGELWVLRGVRAPGADTIRVIRDYLAPDEAPLEGTIPPSIEDRLQHTIVEVVDPVSARLLARIELPFRGIPVAPGYVGRIRQGPDGHYLVSVYRIDLSR